MVTVVDVAPETTLRLVGEMVGGVAQGFAASLTAKLRLAMVSVALRAAPELVATPTVIVALPVPPVGAETQVGAPLTLHVHAEGAVTLTRVLPPADVTENA